MIKTNHLSHIFLFLKKMLAVDGMDTRTKEEKSFKEALEAGKNNKNGTTMGNNKEKIKKINGNDKKTVAEKGRILKE